MKPISALQYFTWSQFSKPSNDRLALRAIKKNKFRSLVEVGLGEGVRCERMIRVAQKYSGAKTIRYTGVDLFEARESSETNLKLIEMHRQLNGLGAKAQLVPGDFGSATQRIANSHLRTDLVIIDCGNQGDVFADEEFASAWKFLPRMLHASSQVMLFFPNDEYEVFNFLDVEDQLRKLDSGVEVKRAA
ncbi:hypothetical protein [Mariniblastus fucicola]|nr:hypothetical protein [Mariniblastus fucicola]